MSHQSLSDQRLRPRYSVGDISHDVLFRAQSAACVACDIETSGLDWHSDRIGLVQLYIPGSEPYMFKPDRNLTPVHFLALLAQKQTKKIFHHAMFDLRFLVHQWGAKPENVSCTKIASKILMPMRVSHSLGPLVRDYLGVTLEKQSYQRSDWFVQELSDGQLRYAARDVLFLPELLSKLLSELEESNRIDLALKCFTHLGTRVKLDVGNFGDVYEY